MPKPCDVCHANSAVVYCQADAAYLCVGCDGKVHGANKLASRHERVWMCEVCELAPAVVTCKADAAALCVACDTDIHSANPLAQRHERVPVKPLLECLSVVKGVQHMGFLVANNNSGSERSHPAAKEDDESSAAEAESWLLPHPKMVADHAVVKGNFKNPTLLPAKSEP